MNHTLADWETLEEWEVSILDQRLSDQHPSQSLDDHKPGWPEACLGWNLA